MLKLWALRRKPGSDREYVRADVTHPDGLGHVVLQDGHVLVGALGAQQPPAVTAKTKRVKKNE